MPRISKRQKLPKEEKKEDIYMTPEKQSTMPRNLSPGRKPDYVFHTHDMPALKIHLFN